MTDHANYTDISGYQQVQSELTAERLRSLITYCPRTGQFHWIEMPRRGSRNRADTNGGRYRFVQIDGVSWPAHRLAVLCTTGMMPMLEIDHIDGDGQNNAYKNLREVSHAENMRNRKLHKNNVSGVHGVHPHDSKWRATIGADGKQRNLGEYVRLDDAIAARLAAEKGAGYHPNHGRRSLSGKKNFSRDVTLIERIISEIQEIPSRAPLNPAEAVSWYEIALYPSRWIATIFGNPVDLTRIEFRILEALVDAQGLAVPRRALWEFTYGTRFDGDSRAIDVHVARLRRKLNASNTLLRSEKEVGYRLESRSPTLASMIAGNRSRLVDAPSATLLQEVHRAV